MIGLIQRVLVSLVDERGGPEAVDRLERETGIANLRGFRIDTNYPDAEAVALWAAGQRILGLDEEAYVDAYADAFMKDGLKRFPTFFMMSKSAREFLERQQTIHNSIAAGLRDPEARQAMEDKFRLQPVENGFIVHYRSPNRLAILYLALARWLFRYYGDTAEVTCLDDPRATACRIQLIWPPSGKSDVS